MEAKGGVFQAKGEGAGPASAGRRALYSALALVLIFGGGYAVVLVELIPGVNLPAVLTMLGVQRQAATNRVVQAVPELAVTSNESEAVSLPLPKIDVQNEVDFRSLEANENDLLTESGRRQYAEKIAVIAGILDAEDFAGAGETEEGELPALFGINEEETEEEVGETSYDDFQIKTARLSRIQKIQVDSQTPSDRVLAEQIRVYDYDAPEKPEAQSDGSGGEETIDVASTLGVDGTGVDSADAEESTAVIRKTSVGPSESGKERVKKLNLARAFFVQRNYIAAEGEYRAILQNNPRSAEALRGLAKVAEATGRYQLAVASYLELLSFHPNDAVALAGLANLQGARGGNFYEMEAALRGGLGRTEAGDVRLQFALGNLYAGQNRWADAQKAYFEAYSGDNQNPDYAYNLAVVLDYLNKPAQAASYYEQALRLSQQTPAGFDSNVVAERIRVLAN